MTEEGHAAVEFAMAVAVLMLPVILMVTAFGPWSERRVFAESAAAEAARAAVLSLDTAAGVWAPLFVTPWGPVGGVWVSGDHSEPVDLYRSLP